jgi:hypothetical protein
MSEAAEATRQRAASRSEVRHGRILRLRGSEELYASDYSDEALDGWAARIRSWRAGGEPNDARLIDRSTRPSRRPPTSTSISTTTRRCARPMTRDSLRRKLADLNRR